MSRTLHLQGTNNTEEYVDQVIASLREGQIVVFPTETVYGLGALASNEDAVQRLINAKGRQIGHALPIAIAGIHSLSRYIPSIDVVSERLARRCWPGPLTLVLDDPHGGELYSLPKFVLQAIKPDGCIGFRVPRHDFFLEVLQRIDEPLILTSANVTGEPPAISAEMATVGLGDKPDLFLDDGPALLQTPSSVVRVKGQLLQVIREGAITRNNIKRLTAKIILFVCTGNTCRSPMAEMLCSQMLAARLDCELADLENNGYVVMSAGVATLGVMPASTGAKEAIKQYGLTLERHESQSVCESILKFADVIFVMGNAHRNSVLAQWPETENRLHLLRPDEGDIADPLGGSVEDYCRCANQIEQAIEKRMNLIV